MTINGGRKYLILLIINHFCYFKTLRIICVKVCQHCAKLCLTVFNCVKVCQSVLNGAQLCQIIKIKLFQSLKAFCAKLCQTVLKCAKVCQSVQNVRHLLSYAQFGTVLHSLTYFGTDWYSSTHFSILQHKNVFRQGSTKITVRTSRNYYSLNVKQ